MENPERWQQLERLLDRALELAPGDRGVFLDRACAGDPALRAELERLLHAAEQAGSFLRQPASAYAMPLVDRLAEAESLTPGTLLGAYEIIRQLGRGGMATVYLARDLRHDRKVALKVLRPELSALLGTERFLHEIRVTANLQHPHILPLFDSGAAEGRLFYVLPFVDGESLRARLGREKQLPIEEALRIARDVASALDHAHRQGVIHRDIKPENILLQDGTALVADFGIALALREAGGSRLTETGLSVGTPQYMSPEQATGDRLLDGRSDLYSLGVVLYEMLTGEPPHTGPTAQAVIAKLLTETPMRLRARRDTVPEALENAVSKALARLPADRFPSVAEFARALVVEPPAVRAPRRPRRRIVVSAGLGAVAAVTAVLIANRLNRAGNPAPPPLATPVQATFTGNVQTAAISRDGSRLALATRECDPQNHCSVALSWQDLGGAGSVRVTGDLPAIYWMSWSPDGRYLLFEGTDRTARYGDFRVAALGGQPEFVGCCDGEFLGSADTVLLTPGRPADGRVVIQLVTASDGRVRDSLVVVRSGVVARGAVPSPDGRWIFLHLQHADLSSTLLVTDRRGRPVDSVVIGSRIAGPRVHPDGWMIVLAEVDPDRQRGRLLKVAFDARAGRLSPPTPVVDWHDGLWYFDVSESAIVFGARPTATAINALVRVGQGPRYTSRTLLRATVPLFANIAPDGHAVAIKRPGPDGKHQLIVLSFDGGRETPVAPPDALGDWVWAGNTRIFYTVETRGRGFRLFARDLTSGVTREHGVVPNDHNFRRLWDGAVASPSRLGRELLIIAADGSQRRVSISDSTAGVSNFFPQPGGPSVVTTGWNTTQDTMIVGRLWPDDGRFVRLAEKVVEGWSGGVWLPSGQVELVLQETLGTSTLYRIDPDGGPLVQVGPMPYGDAYYLFSADGRRAVATVFERRADVWIVRNASDEIRE